MIRRAVVTLALALLVPGCASDPQPGPSGNGRNDEELAGQEWNREGDAWDEFNDGYLTGWEAGCDLVFDESPDGSLYDQGIEYTVEECYDLAPFDASDSVDVPNDLPADPYGEGEIIGETEGCVAAFEELPTYGVLNWGEDSFDESLCP